MTPKPDLVTDVTLAEDAQFTDEEGVLELDPTPVLAALAAMDPADARKAVAAGALLVSKAGDLWDALLGVSESNTAKPLLDKIVDVALTVALAEDTPDL